MTAHRVLIVDDEPGIREALKQVLEYEGYEVATAASGGEALTRYEELQPHVVFLDVKMAGLDGLETLSRIKEIDPGAVVVMISGHGTVATAVQATQLGAFDFLEKPLETDRTLLTVRNALQQQTLSDENQRLRAVIDDAHAIVGHSAALKAVEEVTAKVGPTSARVLILGENGTGKELVARAIHRLSQRADRPMIEVNCAAIPAELIESELFGHVKGSFTGAFADRTGKFELASGGTLFLDEVGDMALSAQAKVLRALQEGVITRIGAGQPIEVDVRVISATNKNLEEEIAAGRFREDLLYRLNVVEISVPPLRDRREDIPELVAHFSSQLAAAGLAPKPFADDALRVLASRSWPGNIRELRNAVERAMILSDGKTVTARDVQRLLGGTEAQGQSSGDLFGGPRTFESFKQEAEERFLITKLREHQWNVSETARALQMPRSNLYKKIERYGLTREST